MAEDRIIRVTHAPQRKRWTKWGRRTFIAFNLAGVILAIPLLSAITPLLRIWWDTRSADRFVATTPVASTVSTEAPTQRPPATSSASAEMEPAFLAPGELEQLTNRLGTINHLSDRDIQGIVSSQFGQKKRRNANPAVFDRDSAVFHKITRKLVTVEGKLHYSYEVDLVDENGNHRIQNELLEEPDMDYERSIATLNLVHSNPQLKKIYDAFSHVLAERSASPQTNTPTGQGSAPGER